MSGRGMTAPNLSKPDDKETNFVTECLLVDMTGGRFLGKVKLAEPSRQLWLDPDDRLVVRNELDDEEEFAPYESTGKPVKKPKKPPPSKKGAAAGGMPSGMQQMMFGTPGKKGRRK
jgi:hypothetical protein